MGLDGDTDHQSPAQKQSFVENKVLPEYLGHRAKTVTVKSTVEELIVYLTEGVVEDVNTMPLMWWKGNAYRFPKLAAVARTIFGIPASYAASERGFIRA